MVIAIGKSETCEFRKPIRIVNEATGVLFFSSLLLNYPVITPDGLAPSVNNTLELLHLRRLKCYIGVNLTPLMPS